MIGKLLAGFTQRLPGGDAPRHQTAASEKVLDYHEDKEARQHGRIERLCQEIGWSIDGRDGYGNLILHFRTDRYGARKVYIRGGNTRFVHFGILSATNFPARQVPAEVLGYLMDRNQYAHLAAWHTKQFEGGRYTGFLLTYVALGQALTPELFKELCGRMVWESVAFDDKMQEVGLWPSQ